MASFDLDQIKRFLSPNAYKDLDTFLEKLPARAGHGLIIAGAIAWGVAGMAVLYATMQINHVMSLRADILKAEALKPSVPVIVTQPVDGTQVTALAKRLADIYPQLTVVSRGNVVEISSPRVEAYGAFREAVGHLFNGGDGWRANVESMCMGRECANGGIPLKGAFPINRLNVEMPSG